MRGIPRCGPARATGLLAGVQTYREGLDIVKRAYQEAGLTEEILTQYGIALWIRRKPSEIWSIDNDYS